MTSHHIDDDHLDTALTRYFAAPSRTDDASADRIARRLAARRLPRQTGAWLRWPTVLLNWDLSPAWPRVTALAACAALGFVIGLAGLDTRIDDASAAPSVTSGDLPSLIFDVEPL
ncbi:MAG TPA: hypothetical protein VNQ56_08950 [Pseudolabrys sp.]|nr:hypothetical protein [Pseudolabrys sp.]